MQGPFCFLIITVSGPFIQSRRPLGSQGTLKRKEAHLAQRLLEKTVDVHRGSGTIEDSSGAPNWLF